MKNINVCLLAAVACTYSIQATANSLDKNLNLILNDNVISLHDFQTATDKFMPIELKPVTISDRAVKLAGVCSITDPTCTSIGFGGKKDPDMGLDSNKQCRESGYNLSSCPQGNWKADFCPHDSSYFTTCCPDAVSQDSCSSPQLVDKTCGGKVSCKCGDEFIYNSNNCSSPKKLGGETCSNKVDGALSINYTECSCPSDYEACSSPKVGDGESCSETRPFGPGDLVPINGIPKYKACKCPDDFMQCFNGPETGAKSCTDGSTIKHDKCNGECPEKCDFTYCPKGYVCEYEQCSNRYCPTGCEIDTAYINMNTYWCNHSLKCFFKSDEMDEYGKLTMK